MIESAFVLAGGLGQRLRPITNSIPKCLITIGGRPIIEYQLYWMRRHGVRRVYLLVGFLHERIQNYLGNRWRDVEIRYIVEHEQLGTGGALMNASSELKSEGVAFVVNGDILTNINLSDLGGFAMGSEKPVIISLVPLRSPFGVVRVDGDDVMSFVEKPIIQDYWMNAGVYVMKSSVIPYFPKKGDLERYTFPILASQRMISARRYNTPPFYWRSIDTHKDIAEAEEEKPDRFLL